MAACAENPSDGGDLAIETDQLQLTAVAPSVIDIGISNQHVESNGTGITLRTDPKVPCFVISGSSGYDTRVLVRFQMPSLPAGSVVTAASMQLSFEAWDDGLNLLGRYISSTWDPNATMLGWLQRTSSANWAVPGAGSDTLASPTFSIGGFPGTGDTTKTIALDPAVVQGWINTPSSNQGFLLSNTASDVVGRLYTNEHTNAALRPSLTITYQTGAPSCVTANSGAGFVSNTFAQQTGTFTVEFDAIASQNPIDAVFGLSNGAPSGYTSLAAAVRMNTSGNFDARNAGAYQAVNTISYSPNTTYHIKMTVNVGTKTYSATVKQGAGPEQTIANNYAFRTEQSGATALDRLNAIVEPAPGGSAQQCTVTVTGGGGPNPPTVTLTNPTSSSPPLSGTVTLQATAAASDGITNVEFLVDGAVVGSDSSSPYSFSYNTTAKADGTYPFAARATSTSNQQTTSTAVNATIQNGSTSAGYYCGDTNSASESAGNAVNLVSTHPRILLNNSTEKTRLATRYNGSDPSAVNFRNLVINEFNQNSTTPVAYEFQAWYFALAGQLTNNTGYLDRAVTYVQSYIDDARAEINAGQRPVIAFDSYLDVGPDAADIMLVYDWAYDRLSSTQRTEWAWFVEHAIWNVWHYEDATWTSIGGPTGTWADDAAYPWSGWSTDNPFNNYYFSFLKATMLFGMAARGHHPRAAGWLGCFRQTKLQNQLVSAYSSDLDGGGSREGTGYGVAHRNLFELYDLYEKSTGDAIADLTDHARESLAWMIHALTPDQKFIAPYGDHSRDNTAKFYDYHRIYIEELTELYANDQLAPFGQWVSKNPLVEGTSRIRDSFNRAYDFLYYDPARTEAPLSGLRETYYGPGTGMVFMRSAFASNATWASIIAGPYTESHAHRDQGSFTIYNQQFLADDENRFTQSGIEQQETTHNLIRLSNGSGTIQQQFNSSGQLRALEDEPSYAYAATETETSYASAVATQVRREMVFIKPNTFVIYDRVAAPSTTKTFQLHSGILPTENDVVATISNATSNMTMRRIFPTSGTMSVVTLPHTGGRPTSYRVEMAGTSDTTEFLTVFSINGAVSTAVASDATGLRGVTITLAAGGTATVRFNTNSTFGGTISLNTPLGTASGALPTAIESIPLLD